MSEYYIFFIILGISLFFIRFNCMAKSDDANGCSFGSVVITIVVVLCLKYLILDIIPDLFKNKDKIINEYEISSMEGDWKVFRYEKY
jgi:hypothetical protein